MADNDGAARGIQITFDCIDPHAQARWWAGLVGYEVEDGHEQVTSLIEAGVITEDITVEIDGRRQFAAVAAANDPAGAGPRFFFQQVPEAKVAKNRVHLDLPASQDELDARVDEVVGHGASLVGFDEYPGHRWAVMADPEGNEFCIH